LKKKNLRYRGKGFWFDPPQIQLTQDGYQLIFSERLQAYMRVHGEENRRIIFHHFSDIFSESRKFTRLIKLYNKFVRTEISQFIKKGGHPTLMVIEPLLLGAGGMVFVDPLFQHSLMLVARNLDQFDGVPSWPSIPVLFDEVFVGLRRLHPQVASPGVTFLGHPDIAVYGKLLSGGLVPLSATLATQEVFDQYLDEGKENALLHGHSYSAYAVGCEISNTSLDLMEELLGPVSTSFTSEKFFHDFMGPWNPLVSIQYIIPSYHILEDIYCMLYVLYSIYLNKNTNETVLFYFFFFRHYNNLPIIIPSRGSFISELFSPSIYVVNVRDMVLMKLRKLSKDYHNIALGQDVLEM